MPYLPTHVRIMLTVVDERGKEVSYSTDARIQMTEKVGYRERAPPMTRPAGASFATSRGARRSTAANAASRCWSC